MTPAVLLYLGAPAVLYLITFMTPAFGWPLAGALVLLLWRAMRSGDGDGGPRPPTLFAAAWSLPVLALMGFGTDHFNWDWIKHWALLNTLEAQTWPVQLTLQGEPAFLRFYLGAYLVPAGLAYLTGWSIVGCTAVWYGLGLALAFEGLGRGAGRLASLVIPLFLTMGGADGWMQTLLRPEDRPISFTGFHHEWWANTLLDHPLQYSAPLSQLLWVPHQALPCLLFVGLLLRLRRPADIGPTVLATGLLALWSPYVLIGASVLLAAQLLEPPDLRHALRHPSLATTSCGVFAAVFVGLMAWTLSHQVPQGGLCLDCVGERLTRPGAYVLFLAVELAIPALILRGRLVQNATSVAALAILTLLPWTAGSVPDAAMRISMPPLVYLFARSALHITQLAPRRLAPAVMAVATLSGPTAWGEATFHLEGGARHAALPAHDPLAARSYVVWARRSDYAVTEFFDICGWKWRPQYFSSTPAPTWPGLPTTPSSR
ncbi:hypothetical protein [Roseateles sp.]|uniref:hypothetical protein n=1 Tax=Roseateles sp. TaxID=1971397 RepID=UPI002DFE1B48|nr:hypothetical protein [Roseateles sp.]